MREFFPLFYSVMHESASNVLEVKILKSPGSVSLYAYIEIPSQLFLCIRALKSPVSFFFVHVHLSLVSVFFVCVH